jgi:hypothetical protein
MDAPTPSSAAGDENRPLRVGGGQPTWFGVAVATLALAGVLAGEFLERSLFFTTASPPR